MKGAGKVSTVVAAILCTASIAAAYNAEAIFFDIASDTDSTCAFYDLPCKRGIYIEARDSWVPVAQEAGTYHQMLQMWGGLHLRSNAVPSSRG